ncbi:MAG: ABC-F family ATP-binding cassette domain-containing protein [Acidobacteriia bacterium]|nr:ABC-F family ATP-binding cassette domain-containing protein [Terriglobia bacterium]
MIQFAGAGKRFGPRILFEDLDWLVTPQDRVGIVGGNGTGKSTILKILAGLESLDYGALNKAKGLSIGYLPQEGLLLSGRTVFSECLSVFDHLHAMEREMEDIAHGLGELRPASPEYLQASERFHYLQTRFATHDGYSLESKVGTVLAGLGFPTHDWHRPTQEFSGGWQMRIALAKLLLECPDLLLLDEPTNHLDIEARNWLEDYLTSYPGAFILISHDRYFLDVTVKKIVEVWNRRVHFYPGNYEKYLQQKTERIEQIRSAWVNQQAKIEQLSAFISRFRAQATKAKQVQSRIKELERMEKVEAPPPEEKTIRFNFPQPRQSGRVVAEFKNVSKSYGGLHIFSGVQFTIERGERIALVGHNGAGKSTLIKLLAGAEPLSAGHYQIGHNVLLEYFAQDQYKELDPNSNLIDDISAVAPKASNTELRNLLGCFLFSEDDVFKKMGVLSGGERNRYALARLLLQPANFLLLDEPTNHLDMRAKDVLLAALQNYSGTVVFVSHDRYFMDKLATRVFEIGSGEVKIYPGNYEDYLWRISGQSLPTVEKMQQSAPEAAPVPQESVKRVNPLKLQKMKERLKQIEQETGRLESEIQTLEQDLGVFVNVEQSQRLTTLLEAKRQSNEKLMAEWETLSVALESV